MYENFNTMTFEEAKVYLRNIRLEQEKIQPSVNMELYEKWTDLVHPDIKPIYRISDYGRVLNINTGNILKQASRNIQYPWYLTLGLQKNDNKRVIMYTHILVAIHFIPKTEEDIKLGRDCINHINGIKCDPRACNLQWVTKEENNRYVRLIHENEGIITKPFWYDTKSKWGCKSTGSSNGMAKHNEEEVIQICELLEKGYDCKQCAEIISSKSNDDFNTTYKWIQSIAARRRWKCVSDSYNF